MTSISSSSPRLTIRKSFVGTLSVVWIILISGGVFLNSASVVAITLLLSVGLFCIQILFIKNLRGYRLAKPVAYLAVMAACLILSMLANHDLASFLTYARLLVVLALALGTSLLLSNERIVEIFVKAVVILSISSLLLFYSNIVVFNASYFPSLEFNEHVYINALIYTHLVGLADRNHSIFIEPGLYQIYINMALFALLYSGRKVRGKYVYVAVLVAALISTKSTTGYLVGALLIGGLAFVGNSDRYKLPLLAVKFAMVSMLLVFVTNSEFFITNIEEKISGVGQKSFVTRQNSTLIDLHIIAESPLTGGGIGSYQRQLDDFSASGYEIDAATNTFTQIGAIVGLPFLLLVVYRLTIYTCRLSLHFAAKAIFLLSFVVCFATQPFVLYPLFYLPVFLSFHPRIAGQVNRCRASRHTSNGNPLCETANGSV